MRRFWNNFLLASILWLLVFLPRLATASIFSTPTSTPSTGTNPLSVTTGDFDGDGKLDIAVANKGSNSVSVLIGNGDGTFNAKVDYATGNGSYGVAAGDLDGDGKLDLVVVNNNVGSDTVSVLIGNGDGTFKAKVDYATGTQPIFVAIGDFDGDGKPDLATANNKSNNLSIFINKGDGTFNAKVDYATGTDPSSVAIGDFDGDGKPDLATANFTTNNISVLINKAATPGTFNAKVDYTTGANSNPNSVTTGDFDGDGKPDLAAAAYGLNSVSVFIGNGDGTFNAKADYATGNGPSEVAAADFNGDGKSDIVTTNVNVNTVSVLIGNGDGTFTTPDPDVATGNAPRFVAAGDFDGDGNPDLAMANNNDNTVSIFLNTSTTACNPDLTITITPPTNNLIVGSHVTFAIAVGNQATCDAEDNSLDLNLSDNQIFVSASSEEAVVSCSGSQTVNCSLSNIEAQGSTTMNVVTLVTGGGVLTMTVTATSTGSGTSAIATAADPRSLAGDNTFGGCALNLNSIKSINSQDVFLMVMMLLVPLLFRRFKKAVVVAVLLSVFVSIAEAETNRFSALFYKPAMEPDDYIVTMGTSLLPRHRWRLWTTIDYSRRPVQITISDNRVQGIDDHLLVQNFGVAFSPASWWELEADLPVVWLGRFQAPVIPAPGFSSQTDLGDLLLRSRLNLLRKDASPIGLAVIPYVTLPTGNQSHFVGDRRPTGGALVAVDAKVGKRVSVGGNFGIEGRERVTVLDVDSTGRILMSAAAAVDLGKGWTVKGDLQTAAALSKPYRRKAETPVELMAGVDYAIGDGAFRVNAGGGVSVVRGAGEPLFRVLAGLTYAPRRKEKGVEENKEFLAVVYFSFNSARLTPESKASLNESIERLKRHPESDLVIAVGHTDSVGSKAYNLQLSLRRAKAVRQYLTNQEISVSRIKIRGMGKNQPVTDNKTKTGRVKNRRVEIKTEKLR